MQISGTKAVWLCPPALSGALVCSSAEWGWGLQLGEGGAFTVRSRIVVEKWIWCNEAEPTGVRTRACRLGGLSLCIQAAPGPHPVLPQLALAAPSLFPFLLSELELRV